MWKKIKGVIYWTEEGRVWRSTSRVIATAKAKKVGGEVTEYPFRIFLNNAEGVADKK